DGVQCDDGDPCTGLGTCSNGACSKGKPINCSFLDGPCTAGVCDPQIGCKSAPKNNGAPCDDGLFCTINDHCQGGQCVGGGPSPCAAANGCSVGACNEGAKTCSATPGNNGAPCDDGNVCTVNTTCLNGACVGGQPVNEGMPCDDGSPCTSNTTCQGGQCGG